jgi:hypothetical protein
MKKLLIIFALILGMIFLSSCYIYYPGRYAPPKLEKGRKRSPEEDFVKLTALFKKYNGKLFSKNDSVVKWKDTKIYRIYEFKHHSIAVFPYNWNEKCFDMYIFSGHLKKYDNMLKDIYFTCYPEGKKGVYYINETMNFDNVFPRVGLKNFKLGMPKNIAREREAKKLFATYKRQGYSDLKAKRAAERPPVLNNSLESSTDDLYYMIEFVDNKIVWMHFNAPGTPMISHMGLGVKEKLGVLEEGEFKLPIKPDGPTEPSPNK